MANYKIFSWNVNGLRAVHRKGFLETMAELQPDVFCFQESKAQTDQLADELINIPSYNFYHFPAEKKGYSGVGFYSRIKPLKVETGLGMEMFDSEGRVISAEFPEFILINAYFPNGKASAGRLEFKMDFNKKFLEYLNYLPNKKIIVCGDVNTAHKEIDLFHPKANENTSGFLPEERKWIDDFLAAGFVDSFRSFNQEPLNYTWWSLRTAARERNVGWRIDYFFHSTDLDKNVVDSRLHQNILGSDHCPVSLELDFD